MKINKAVEAPKLVATLVQEKFRQFADDLFASCAEPRNLMLVVDWQVGQKDFPAGIMMTRDRQTEIHDLLNILGQLDKMIVRVVHLYSRQLGAIDEEYSQLLTLIEQKRKELEELKKNE